MSHSHSPTGKSSYLGASFNFINSIVGAGIIGIPYAIDQCGLFTGIFMLTFVAFLVNRSVLMLLQCGIKAEKYQLEEVAQHYLGEIGYCCSLLVMFLFAYGAQIAYLIIIGDTIPVVCELFFGDSIATERNVIIGSLAVLIILPLCLLKDLSSLSWTSLLSVIGDTILIIIIVIASPMEAKQQGIHPDTSFIKPSLFAGIGTISFAFVCQHNSFLVFQSLKEPTFDNWRKVAHLSVGFSYSLCLIFGLSGYLSFADLTDGDLITNFPSTNVAVNVSRFLLGATMLFTFPMECFVSRYCLTTIFLRYKTHRRDRNRRSVNIVQSNRIANTSTTASFTNPFSMLSIYYRRHNKDNMKSILLQNDVLTEDHENVTNNNAAKSTSINRRKSVNASSRFNTIGEVDNDDEDDDYENESEFVSVILSPLNQHHNLPHIQQSPQPQQQRWQYNSSFSINNTFSQKQPQLLQSQKLQRNSLYTESSSRNNNVDSDSDYIKTTIINFEDIEPPNHITNNIINIPVSNALDSSNNNTNNNTVADLNNNTINNAYYSSNNTNNTDNDDELQLNRCEYLSLTLLLWGSSLCLALLCSDLGVVLALTGAVAASILGYVLPGLIYIKAYEREFCEVMYLTFGLIITLTSNKTIDHSDDAVATDGNEVNNQLFPIKTDDTHSTSVVPSSSFSSDVIRKDLKSSYTSLPNNNIGSTTGCDSNNSNNSARKSISTSASNTGTNRKTIKNSKQTTRFVALSGNDDGDREEDDDKVDIDDSSNNNNANSDSHGGNYEMNSTNTNNSNNTTKNRKINKPSKLDDIDILDNDNNNNNGNDDFEVIDFNSNSSESSSSSGRGGSDNNNRSISSYFSFIRNNCVTSCLSQFFTPCLNISQSIQSTKLYTRLYSFHQFYLPVFMILFGIVALVTGVGTIIMQSFG